MKNKAASKIIKFSGEDFLRFIEKEKKIVYSKKSVQKDLAKQRRSNLTFEEYIH